MLIDNLLPFGQGLICDSLPGKDKLRDSAMTKGTNTQPSSMTTEVTISTNFLPAKLANPPQEWESQRNH